jgi:hypothetical protein
MAACSRALGSLKMVAASSSSVHQSSLSLPTLERRTATAGNDCRILTPSPSIWSRAEILPYPTPCRRSYSVDEEGRMIMSISDQILSELRESDIMKSRKVQLLLLLRSPSAPVYLFRDSFTFGYRPHIYNFSYIFSRFILLGCPTFPLEKTKKNSSSPEGCAVAVHATFVQIENPIGSKEKQNKKKKRIRRRRKEFF